MLLDHPLAPLTSFRVGGRARYFVEPQNSAEVQQHLAWAKEQSLSVFVLGKGTNLIVSDEGFDGLVMYLGAHYNFAEWSDTSVHAAAGVLLATVVRESVRRGLAGMECLGGIPGTVGGAVAINAGAYGQEIKMVAHDVLSCTQDGQLVKRFNNECHFTYRDSIYSANHEIVLEATFQLCPDDKEKLSAKMTETLAHRKRTQPLQWPNAGSIFKRPDGKFPGALIETAGCKGWREGGADISTIHANFIVNMGGATATDIWKLSERVIAQVKKVHGITLEREVRWIGPPAKI